MFRSLLIWFLAILVSLVLTTIACVVGLIDKSGRSAHWVGRVWGKSLVRLSGVKVKVEGLENLPKEPCILVSNHQGVFDITVLLGYLPLFFSWIAKKQLFKIPFIGHAMKAARYVEINREDSRQAMRDLKKAANRTKEGCSLIIFPEGTRTRDGKLGEFKRGSLLLAGMAKAPVVPISIDGSYKLMKAGTWHIIPGSVTVKIHPSINYQFLTRTEQKEFTLKVREIIASGLPGQL